MSLFPGLSRKCAWTIEAIRQSLWDINTHDIASSQLLLMIQFALDRLFDVRCSIHDLEGTVNTCSAKDGELSVLLSSPVRCRLLITERVNRFAQLDWTFRLAERYDQAIPLSEELTVTYHEAVQQTPSEARYIDTE